MRAALLALLLLAPAAPAQVERYELGRRLKRFEAEWEKVTDPAARKRALAILPKASAQFLSLNLTEAARTVDDAYWALKSAEPPAAGVRWLDSLILVPEKRLVDDFLNSATLEVRHLYPAGDPPPGVRLRVGCGKPDQFQQCPDNRLPWQGIHVNLPRVEFRTQFAPIDTPLFLHADADGSAGATQRVVVTSVTSLEFKRKDWRLLAGGGGSPNLEQATVIDRAAFLDAVAGGLCPETDDFSLAEMDIHAGLIARFAVTAQPYYRAESPGQMPLSIPTGTDARTPCRLLVPAPLAKNKPVPLVVALHGAGGSENMFFESYGAGHIVKECQKRGWLLVSPRSGLLGTPPVAAIVDKLAERYPIDPKRVYVVGHSMGAGQAVDLVQRHPGKFAAVAVLGGGGRVRQKEAFADLPVFVGMGTADFARRSGQSLVKTLTDAGAKRVTAKEYPDLEHLLIVREALPDVFAVFDGVAR